MKKTDSILVRRDRCFIDCYRCKNNDLYFFAGKNPTCYSTRLWK